MAGLIVGGVVTYEMCERIAERLSNYLVGANPVYHPHPGCPRISYPSRGTPVYQPGSFTPIGAGLEDDFSDLDGEKQSYTRMPPNLIELIVKHKWKILEMCAGNGFNHKLLQQAGVDSIAFDFFENAQAGVKHASNGTVEADHPDRTLLLNTAINAEECLQAYTGNRVILGGYGQITHYKKKFILLDMTRPMEITPAYVSNGCGEEKNSIELMMRPNYEYMISNGWVLKNTICSKKNGTRWNEIFHIFQIWEREGFEDDLGESEASPKVTLIPWPVEEMSN